MAGKKPLAGGDSRTGGDGVYKASREAWLVHTDKGRKREGKGSLKRNKQFR